MRRLKSRTTRIDNLRSEGRPRKRGRVGRYAYLISLAALILFLFDQFAGELVYLKADGMVARDVSIIAPDYEGMVVELPVKEGAHVAEGQLVARLRSPGMLRDLAEMSNDLARVQARLSEMRIRKAKIRSLLPVARERADKLKDYREKIASLSTRGLSTSSQLTAIIDDAFEAVEKVRELEAEKEIMDAELVQAEKTVQRARDALDNIDRMYRNGILTAGHAGMVGTVHVKRGAGVEKGAYVAEIFHGPRYILAYVPTGALYDVEPGQAVALRTGFKVLSGRIEELVQVAPRLPSEFQRTFGTVDRKQLVRIAIQDGDQHLPLFTPVSITSPYAIRPMLARFLVAVRDGIGGIFGASTGTP